jgi:hypothetical protein
MFYKDTMITQADVLKLIFKKDLDRNSTPIKKLLFINNYINN